MIKVKGLTKFTSIKGIGVSKFVDFKINTFTFSGGEVQVIIEKPEDYEYSYIFIEALLRNSEDVMQLLMVTDAIKRLVGNTPINLTMPYIPYARQDRVCNKGEALGIKVFADLINTQQYNTVTVWDSHSDVALALLDRCANVDPSVFIQEVSKLIPRVRTLVSPDAGANKKVFKIAKAFPQFSQVVRADKTRNVATGEIIGTEVYCPDFLGQDVLIVDDILDGGKTFIELAKKLKEKNCGKIYLYVTHGIFSKGVEVFEGLIDQVYVASCWVDSENPILIKL